MTGFLDAKQNTVNQAEAVFSIYSNYQFDSDFSYRTFTDCLASIHRLPNLRLVSWQRQTRKQLNQISLVKKRSFPQSDQLQTNIPLAVATATALSSRGSNGVGTM